MVNCFHTVQAILDLKLKQKDKIFTNIRKMALAFFFHQFHISEEAREPLGSHQESKQQNSLQSEDLGAQ